MPHRSHRSTVAVAAVLVLSVLPACAAGGTSPVPPPAPATTAAGPTGRRTVVERRMDGVAMVVEVVEGARGMAATWSGGAPGDHRLLAEEVRIGTDVWVHLAMTEAGGVTEPAWIHIDLTQPWQREFHEANPLGLLDQRLLWDAGPGDDVDGDGDRIAGVERPSATERVLRLERGGTIHVTRQGVPRAPRIEPPRSLPVVPLRDVEELLVRS